MTDTMPDDDAVREALRQVDDPEAGMNIVDLGLVYLIDVTPEAVRIEMTMTTAACPMTEMIVEQVCEIVTSIVPAGTTVAVELVWDPPWTPDKMSEDAKFALGY